MAEPYTDNPTLAAQIRQLLAERETADAYGMTTRVEAVDKQLGGLGYKPGKPAAKAAVEGPPVERQTPPRETTDAAATEPPRRGPGRPRKSET